MNAAAPQASASELRKVLVGVDGSPESLAAADFAARLASWMNAKLCVAHCRSPYLPVTPEISTRPVLVHR